MKGFRIPPSLCIRCKGYRRLCGLPRCPILEAFHARSQAVARISTRDVAGATPPSIIVGESGYPRVRVLYGIPPGVYGDAAREYGDARLWFSRRYTLTKILRLRSSTVYALLEADVRDPFKLYERELSLAAVSAVPVDSEARLNRIPLLRLSFDDIVGTTGPSAPAENLTVSGTPRVPRKLENLVWDDAPAETSVVELYRSVGDVYVASAALSMGLLGRIKRRRLVPTRWAVTAVDSIVGNYLLRRVKGFSEVNDILLYHGEYLGNRFTVVLLPSPYRAEMIEVWHPYTVWTKDASSLEYYVVRETATGRISEMDGGYMAARLAVLEHLAHIRRQAAVLIVREVTRDYYAPVGSWLIRETVRKTLASKPVKLESIEQVIEELKRLHPSAEKLTAYSNLMRKGGQRRLDEYFTHR